MSTNIQFGIGTSQYAKIREPYLAISAVGKDRSTMIATYQVAALVEKASQFSNEYWCVCVSNGKIHIEMAHDTDREFESACKVLQDAAAAARLTL